MILERSKDPMGRAIYDYSNKAHNNIIKVYSPEFFDDYIETAYLFRGYEDFPEVEQLAMEKAHGNILDIGCGAGVHAKHLIENGKSVEALDISQYICEVVEKQGIKTHCSDIMTFSPNKSYDTLLLLMNGLGIAKKNNQLPLFLNQLKTLLSPKGQILVESCSTDYLFDNPKDAEEFSGEILYQMEYEGIKGTPFHWLYLPYDRLKEVAMKNGFHTELLLEHEGSTYLAKLTVKQ